MSQTVVIEKVDLGAIPVKKVPRLNHIWPPGPLPAPVPEPAFCGHVGTPVVLITHGRLKPRTCGICREIAGYR